MSVPVDPTTKIPLAPLPEIRFLDPASSPPIVSSVSLLISTPFPPLPRAIRPETSVPMKLPAIGDMTIERVKVNPVAAEAVDRQPVDPAVAGVAGRVADTHV